jgi:macrolide-specific efflux system membrane fusion protein
MSLDEADAPVPLDDGDFDSRRWARPPDGDGDPPLELDGPYDVERDLDAGDPTPGDPEQVAEEGGARPRARRRSWMVLAALVVVALVAAGGVWWWTSGSDSSTATAGATTKQLAAVTTGTVNTTVTAQGTVAAAQTDNLNFASAGMVTAVNVKAGDTVTAGQVLASIDGTALQAATAKAQATLDSAQAKLSDDQAAAASSEQIAADQSSVTVAQDALATAQFAQLGTSLVATIDGTVSAVNLTVGEQLSASGTGGTTLSGSGSGSGRSTGTIGSRSGTNQSAQSSSTTPAAQIQVISTGSFAVSLPVAASDIASVAAGQPVSLTVATASTPTNGGFGGFGGGGAFAGLGGGQRAGQGGAQTGANGNQANGDAARNGTNGNGTGGRQANGTGTNGTGQAASAAVGATATGKVADVSKVADTSTGVGTYAVTIDFTADASKFLIGSTVAASITTAQRSGVLLVPIVAVTTTGNESTVTVATNGTVDGPTEVRTVTLGTRSGAMVEVTNGLKDGDQVVVEVPAALANRLGGAGGEAPAGVSGPSGGTGGGGSRRNRTGTSGPTGATGPTGTGGGGTTP